MKRNSSPNTTGLRMHAVQVPRESGVRPDPRPGRVSLLWAVGPFVVILALGLALVHYWRHSQPIGIPFPAKLGDLVGGETYQWLATVQVQHLTNGGITSGLSPRLSLPEDKFVGETRIHAELPPNALENYSLGTTVMVVGVYSDCRTEKFLVSPHSLELREERTLRFSNCRIARAID